METIRTNRILPAFMENDCDFNKIELYAKEMRENDELTGHYGFPPIWGFFDVVDENDLGKVFNLGAEDNEELITKKHLGIEVFRVTDGNHRFIAAVKANIWALETEPDNSGFVKF